MNKIQENKNHSDKTSKKKFKLKEKILISLLIPLFIYFPWIYIIKKKKNNKNKFFFFLSNQTELSYCKNFGLMIYDYNNKSQFINLGDYIQSLAALQFLPKNCSPYLISREKLRYYNGPIVNLFMNGWYNISHGNKIISNHIKPIYLSIHIYNIDDLDTQAIGNFKKYEPIGCRDLSTLNLLRNKGIDSYFSSCLTLTLDIDYGINDYERTNEIIFVDYSFGMDPKIDKFILSLKEYNFNNITFLTHGLRSNISQIERFKLAKNYLDKYARAKLVITTRLHVAFPCLALKTPVILIKYKFFDENRFSGLFDFLNTIGNNENSEFEINVKFDKKNKVINPDKYLKYAYQFKKYLRKLKIYKS